MKKFRLNRHSLSISSISPYFIFITILYIIAISERFYGIWYPRSAWDEHQFLTGARNMLKFMYGILIFDMQTANPHSVVSIYGIAGKYICMLSLCIGKFFEFFISSIEPEFICRILNRIFVSCMPSIFTIFVIHKIIKLLNNSKAFIIFSLFFFCILFKHVETAHCSVPDALSTLFASLCIYYLIKFQMRGNRVKDLIVFSIMASIAASTKINVGMILSATIALILFLEFTRGKYSLKKFVKLSLISSLSFIIPFVIINIPYFVQYSKWLDILRYHINNYAYDFKGEFITYLYFTPKFAVGTGILILSMFGMVIILFDRKRWLYAAPLFFIILFSIYLSTNKGAECRWAIPMGPFFILFASFFLSQLYKTISNINMHSALLSVIVILFFCGYIPFYQIIQFDLNLIEEPQTIDLMKTYIGKEVGYSGCVHFGDTNGCYRCTSALDLTLDEFQNKDIAFLVISPKWCERINVPESLRYKNGQCYKQIKKFEPIYRYVNSNFHLVKIIKPKYFSDWSTNIACQHPYYIYQNVKNDK